MTDAVLTFEGAIVGLGTASGTRLVVGNWLRSPFGRFCDVMVQEPDGHRILLAPTREIADFVGATYCFDEVRIVGVSVAGTLLRGFAVTAPGLQITFRLGGRTGLGLLLSTVPRPIAGARWFATCVDPIARRILPGVRTRGSAGNGRREWYCALDVVALAAAEIRWNGTDLGPLRPVVPAVEFGFGSTPPRPTWVRIRTHVALGPAEPVPDPNPLTPVRG